MKIQFQIGIAFMTLMLLTGCGSNREKTNGTYVCESDSTVTLTIHGDTMTTCNIDTVTFENGYAIIMGLTERHEASAEGLKMSDEEFSQVLQSYKEEIDYSSYANADVQIKKGEKETLDGETYISYYALDNDGNELIGFSFGYYPEDNRIEINDDYIFLYEKQK